ncbi:MAG: 3-hydroxyacyl-CoA dehydrogenase family protein [Candidatus Bathyarchaeia archaeon]
MKVEDVKKIGVLGTGVMGSGIAQVFATFGFDVIARDVSDAVLKGAMNEIIEGKYGLKRGVSRDKITQEQMDGAIKRIKMTTDMDEFCRDVDIVTECVPEDLNLKMRVFAELDKKCPKHTILATNSSGFSITALAGATERPDKVIGTHWFNPPPVMRGVEVIRAPETSDETVEVVKGVLEKCGKVPIVFKDDPMAYGYIANRCYYALAREAMRIVEEGTATETDVDNALKLGYGFPIGPFELLGYLTARGGEPKRRLEA